MAALLWLHNMLSQFGRGVAQLAGLLLALVLLIVPFLVAVTGSAVLAMAVALSTGGGALVWLPTWALAIAVIGFYVAPHIQPQIEAAMEALTKKPDAKD
jgi:hypothetical protein